MMNQLAFQLPRMMSLDSPLKGDVKLLVRGVKKKMRQTVHDWLFWKKKSL